VSLTAEEFCNAYEKDLDRAFNDYGGKVIELTGVVDFCGRNIYDSVFIKMVVPGHLLHGNLGSAHPEPWAIVTPGQAIRLRGKWDTKLSRQGLRFFVVETDTSHRMTVTPDEVARTFEQDERAAWDHFHKLHLALAGIVEAVDFDDANLGGNRVNVVVRTKGKLKLNCAFESDERERLRDVAAGQPIRLIGEQPLVANSRLVLLDCFLVTIDAPIVPTNAELDRLHKDKD
jgi:hypothetical protein